MAVAVGVGVGGSCEHGDGGSGGSGGEEWGGREAGGTHAMHGCSRIH